MLLDNEHRRPRVGEEVREEATLVRGIDRDLDCPDEAEPEEQVARSRASCGGARRRGTAADQEPARDRERPLVHLVVRVPRSALELRDLVRRVLQRTLEGMEKRPLADVRK